MLLMLLLLLLLPMWPAAAWAQFVETEDSNGPRLDRSVVTRIQVGVIIKATGGALQRVVATAPVPADWPEQSVKIVNEDVSAGGSVAYRNIRGGGGLKQMVVEVPQMLLNQEIKALVTYEVTRRVLLAPTDPSIYKLPKKPGRELLLNLGPSPYIESKHPKIIAAAKEAVEGKEGDWQ